MIPGTRLGHVGGHVPGHGKRLSYVRVGGDMVGMPIPAGGIVGSPDEDVTTKVKYSVLIILRDNSLGSWAKGPLGFI